MGASDISWIVLVRVLLSASLPVVTLHGFQAGWRGREARLRAPAWSIERVIAFVLTAVLVAIVSEVLDLPWIAISFALHLPISVADDPQWMGLLGLLALIVWAQWAFGRWSGLRAWRGGSIGSRFLFAAVLLAGVQIAIVWLPYGAERDAFGRVVLVLLLAGAATGLRVLYDAMRPTRA